MHIQIVKLNIVIADLFYEKGETGMVGLQTRISSLYKEAAHSFKKHKKIKKNLHYIKEAENTDVMKLYEIFKELNHEKFIELSSLQMIIKHLSFYNHFEKYQNKFYSKSLTLVIICSFMICLMYLYLIILFYFLY
jgi:hypothetical protein